MKPAVILSIVTAALVVLIFVSQLDRVSPGPIHSTHVRLAGLGNASCESCHGEDGSSMAAACTACHTEIAEQRNRRIGLHGRLPDEQFAACGRCHTDHLGDASALVTERSFARAGFETMENYRSAHDHFSLVGAHAGATCLDCHPHAESAVVPDGSRRFLLAPRSSTSASFDGSCASCHDNPHPDRHGQSFGTDCESCHDDGQRFTVDLDRWHERWFSLTTPAHRSLSCASCHDPSGDHAILALRRDGEATSPRGCQDCHSNPHVARDGVRDGTEDGTAPIAIVNSTDCARCHTPDRFENARFGVDAHAAVGVHLMGAHARLLEAVGGCESCHSAWAGRPENDDPAPRMGQCRACHADPHATAAAEALPFDLGSRSCAECHGVERFAPADVQSADHARFGLALSGQHVSLECAACHDGTRARNEVSTEARCQACHVSPHLAFDPLQSGDPDAPCAPCHATTDASFRYPDSRFPAQEHARTGFALEAPHALAASATEGHAESGLDCGSCHVGLHERSPADESRPFAERFPGRDPAQCEACHGDPHPELRTASLADAACLSCHEAERFVPTHFTVDDHATTRFPLTGAHAALPCRTCHESDANTGALSFGELPRDCRGCHDDAHFGAFEGRSCEECHTTTTFTRSTPWVQPHSMTGFALHGRHAELDCAACHSRREPRVQLESSCQSCHGDPHAGQFPQSCSHCHDPENQFELTTFDHSTHSRFALDSQHAKLACASCHRPVAGADGKPVVRYRPLGTECRDCHGSPGGDAQDGSPR